MSVPTWTFTGVPVRDSPTVPVDDVRELARELRRRATDCATIAEERDTIDRQRVIGKAQGYAHAAELLEVLARRDS